MMVLGTFATSTCSTFLGAFVSGSRVSSITIAKSGLAKTNRVAS